MANKYTVRPDRGVSKLDFPATLVTGEPATVADGIVSRIRAGAYLETAAAATNVHANTVHGWMKTGQAARTKVLSGHTPEEDLTPHEYECLAFVLKMERAEAEWLVGAEAQLEKISRGGLVTTRVTVRKDAQGQVVETIEQTDTAPVDPKVIQWRMERKFPELYGRRTQTDINVGGQPGNPIVVDVDVEALANKMRNLIGGVNALDITEAPTPALPALPALDTEATPSP